MSNIAILTGVPVLNIQLVLDGVLIGSIFALAAYGIALVWGVTGVKNLAQGDLVIMGGYIGWYMSTLGLHPILAMPIAIVFMFGFGWLIYLLIIRHVIGRDLFTSLRTIKIKGPVLVRDDDWYRTLGNDPSSWTFEQGVVRRGAS